MALLLTAKNVTRMYNQNKFRLLLQHKDPLFLFDITLHAKLISNLGTDVALYDIIRYS